MRSVRGRLALALLLVVAGALSIVYLIVVPTTRSSLIDTRVNGLEKNLRNIVADAPPIILSPEWVQQEVVPLADSRVVVFQRLRNGHLRAVFDSSPLHGSSADVSDEPLASHALATLRRVPHAGWNGRACEAARSHERASRTRRPPTR